MDELEHRLGQSHTIICGCAAPDLIKDEQAVLSGIFKRVIRLHHLDHECGFAACKIIARPDPCEDLVEYRQPGGFCRDIHPHLGKYADDRRLAHICALTRHVRPCDQIDESGLIHRKRVRYIRIFTDDLLHDRMPPFFYIQFTIRELRTYEARSEERRVGKEGRYMWWQELRNKNDSGQSCSVLNHH